MGDKRRGDDAQDRTAAVVRPEAASGGKQDGENYEKRVDGGEAIEVENLSSANDEGAP